MDIKRDSSSRTRPATVSAPKSHREKPSDFFTTNIGQEIGSSRGCFWRFGGTNTITSNLCVGYSSSGFGDYEMSDGALSVGGEINVGGRYTSTASGIHAANASTSGAGSRWSMANFYTGLTGTGTTTVAGGGTVESTNTCIGCINGGHVTTNRYGYLGWSNGAQGTVTVTGAGSTLSVNNNLYLGGSISGNTNGTGELVFAGNVSPGNSPDLVNAEGDMTLWGTSSTLMEIAGLTRGSEYDAFDNGEILALQVPSVSCPTIWAVGCSRLLPAIPSICLPRRICTAPSPLTDSTGTARYRRSPVIPSQPATQSPLCASL